MKGSKLVVVVVLVAILVSSVVSAHFDKKLQLEKLDDKIVIVEKIANSLNVIDISVITNEAIVVEEEDQPQENDKIQKNEVVKTKPQQISSPVDTNKNGSESQPVTTPPITAKSDEKQKKQETTHTHQWKATTKTVHHKEVGHYERTVVKEGWYEPVYEEYEIEVCNTCGVDITGNTLEHTKKHTLAGEGGSWHSEWKTKQVDSIYHEPVTKKVWIIDQNAYDESITTGYQCRCGAVK